MSARYVHMTNVLGGACDKCRKPVDGDWYWAPARQAKFRHLCPTCWKWERLPQTAYRKWQQARGVA